ncbi:DNA polymerase [Alteromonas halophila]|uniref:DNA polymerase n=1 Tax=Alteromonas halophila TaxID=516698 RepID=A0A918JQD1_9ALTE|nr:DNA polymerase [Alteromonas halophila]
MVELWLATDEGPACLHTSAQTFSCFVQITDKLSLLRACRRAGLAVETSEQPFKKLDQQPVCVLKTFSESQHNTLRRIARNEEITLFEADIKLSDRYLMERFIYGSLAFIPTATAPRCIHQQVKVRPAHYLPTLSSLTLDIECDEHENLFSIALAGDNAAVVMMIAPPAGIPTPTQPLPFELIVCKDENSLLRELERQIDAADPDVILGWNVKQFDLALLGRRAARLHQQLKLGRHGHTMSVRELDSGQVIVDVPGRCIVDGIESLKTMTYQFDSFSLQHVATELLGKGKLIHEDNPLETIKRQYFEAPLELAKYNYQDCTLVNDIVAHTRLLDFLVLRSTLTGLEPGRPGGSVAAFLNVYLPRLHRAGYISNVRPEDGGLASPGGYVMDSKPGLYQHVLVLDFKSLYPSIIRTFCIDPMGLAEGLLSPHNAVEGFKGACFSRDKHFLPDIIATLWRQRDEAKRAGDGPRSQAIKILMNSFYGVLGSGGCPFYDPRLASSITLRGHQIMQTTADWIRELGFDVIYGDTDSTFVHIADAKDRAHALALGEQLERTINQRWHQTLRQDFSLPCYLEIEFETHFDTFFMPTIRGSSMGSKKRYAGLTQKNGKQEMIFKGLESVRSDWTRLAKDFQYALYSAVFAGQPVDALIKDYIVQIREGHRDQDLVYAKRLRKPLEHYTKSQPPHVRAARIAEQWRADNGQPARYTPSAKIHYVLTTQGPQPTEYVTAPLDYDDYIDKQIKPIAESILPLIGLDFTTLTNDQMTLF